MNSSFISGKQVVHCLRNGGVVPETPEVRYHCIETVHGVAWLVLGSRQEICAKIMVLSTSRGLSLCRVMFKRWLWLRMRLPHVQY